MNKPKAESPERGKSGKAVIYLVDDEPMLRGLSKPPHPKRRFHKSFGNRGLRKG